MVAACLIFFLQVLFGALQNSIFRHHPQSQETFWLYLLLPLLFSGFSVLLPFAIYNRLIGERLKPIFQKQRLLVSPAVAVSGIFAVCGFAVLFRFFAMHLVAWLESFGFVFTRNVPPTDNPVLFVIFSALIPAAFYELAFRGIMAERIREWSPAAAVILSAAVYSLCHLSLDIIPHALAVGLVLGWLYLKTSSVLLSFAASALANALLAGLWVSGTLSLPVAAAGGVLGILGLISCVFLTRKEKISARFPKKDVLRGVFSSFALYTFFVITFLGLMFYHINRPQPDSPQSDPVEESQDNPFVILPEDR